MKTLAGAATGAGGKVGFVVAAHLRREAGDIVTPASQDVADHGIHALFVHAKAGWLPAPATARRASTGCAADWAGEPAPFPRCRAQSPGGCSARKGAPGPRKPHS